MNDIVQNAFNLAWGMGLSGIQNAPQIMRPGGPLDMARAAGTMAGAAAQTFSQSLNPDMGRVYERGDRLQRQSLDALLNAMGPMDPTAWADRGLEVWRRMAETMESGAPGSASGWGPVSPPGA